MRDGSTIQGGECSSLTWYPDTPEQRAAEWDLSWFVRLHCPFFPRAHALADFLYPEKLRLRCLSPIPTRTGQSKRALLQRRLTYLMMISDSKRKTGPLMGDPNEKPKVDPKEESKESLTESKSKTKSGKSIKSISKGETKPPEGSGGGEPSTTPLKSHKPTCEAKESESEDSSSSSSLESSSSDSESSDTDEDNQRAKWRHKKKKSES